MKCIIRNLYPVTGHYAAFIEQATDGRKFFITYPVPFLALCDCECNEGSVYEGEILGVILFDGRYETTEDYANFVGLITEGSSFRQLTDKAANADSRAPFDWNDYDRWVAEGAA